MSATRGAQHEPSGLDLPRLLSVSDFLGDVLGTPPPALLPRTGAFPA